MNIQKQPNMVSCLATSAAMLLNMDVEELFKEIGHKGMEVIDPDATGLMKFRSFHIQEIQKCFIKRGFILAPIEAIPSLMLENGKGYAIDQNIETFEEMLESNYKGILIGDTSRGLHAVAWNGHIAYDPMDGGKKRLADLDMIVKDFWVKVRL